MMSLVDGVFIVTVYLKAGMCYQYLGLVLGNCKIKLLVRGFYHYT